MRQISNWSTRRVIVACALWLFGAPVLAAIGILVGGLVLAVFSGHQRIGFTVGLSNWFGAWLFLPPIALVAAWFLSRRRPNEAHGTADSEDQPS
jgi:membrane protein implicated in regulation of membrane protease activity